MIPQLIMAVWLTLTFVALARYLYIGSDKTWDDQIGSVIGSVIYTAVPVVALHYAGFWIN